MRAFLQDLQSLSGFVTNPPQDPTAYVGDQDATKIQTDAKQAGCSIGGGNGSTSSSSSTTTGSAASNPQAKAVCTQIISDIPALGTGANGIGQYGKDVAKLMSAVPSSQQSVVIRAVGHLTTLLHDLATGADATSAEAAVTSDAKQIGQICAGYMKNP